MTRIIKFTSKYIYSLAYCIYIFTIGIFFTENRSFIYTIYRLFYPRKKSNEAIIPKIELSEVIKGSTAVQIREPVAVHGNVSLLELVAIAELIKLYNPGKLFEIGTFNGRTTLNMALNCSPEAIVYTLDLPKDKVDSTKLSMDFADKVFVDKEVSGSRYLGTDCEQKIVSLYGDSATFNFCHFFNKIDFIFIDGSHSYEYVINDSKQALNLLKNGQGVVLWHDYGEWEGVTRALNELYLGSNEFEGLKHIKETSLVYLVSV